MPRFCTNRINGYNGRFYSRIRVSVLGPYDNREDAAANKEKVLLCVLDAYIKSINR